MAASDVEVLDCRLLPDGVAAGATWGAFLTNPPLNGGAKALAVDPTDPDEVFDVCGSCWGVYGIRRTLDGGQTWQNVAPTSTWGLSVAIDPTDSQHIRRGNNDGNPRQPRRWRYLVGAVRTGRGDRGV